MLGADIDLSGKEFVPIGDAKTPFTGRFSGNGHTISNAVQSSEEQYAGLFGYNEGTIMNLAVKDSKVTGNSAYTGGICGFSRGTIYGCSYEGTVNGNENTGAICGYNSGGMISNCYAVADVSATGNYTGGICALNLAGSTIDSCYFAGKVTGAANGIVFAITGSDDGTVTNCSYNQDLCTKSSLENDAEVKGLTTYEMTSKNALADMGLSNGIFVKKDNDTENSIAYYPSFSKDTAPAVKYTVGLEFTDASNGNPYCYDCTAFYYNAFIEFGENIRKWDTNGKFSIKIGDTTVVEPDKFVENHVDYKTQGAGEVTFTLCYENDDSEFFPKEITKDLNITINKRELAEYYFGFMAPSDLQFDNRKKTASVEPSSLSFDIGEITVKYLKNGVETEPVSAGDYTVKIDVAESDTYKAATDLTDPNWKFTIEKGIPTASYYDFSVPSNLAYDGTDKKAAVTAKNSMTGGRITVKYYVDGVEVQDTSLPNTYTVKIDVTESDNCKAATDITDPDWKFTVTMAAQEKPDCKLSFKHESDDTYTAEIASVAGAEYKFGDGDWGDRNTLTGIGHRTAVTAYIRLKGTAGYYVSDIASDTKTTGHGAMVHTEAKAATGTEDGNKEYWYCSKCNKFFADADGNTEITDFVLPATGTIDVTPDETPDETQPFMKNIAVKSKISGNTAKLSWNKITNADKYIIYQLKNGKYVKIKTTTGTSLALKNLKNGKTYKYMIRYTVNGKLSPMQYSKKITVKIYYKPIVKAAASGNKVKLSWKAVPKAKKYAVYKYVNGKKVLYKKTKKLSVNISGLKSGKKYQYIVRAYVNGKWTEAGKSDIVTVKTKK